MENLLNTGTEIKYDGGKITVRRLGVIDVFKFAKLLSKVGKSAFSQIAAQLGATKQLAKQEGLTDEQLAEIKKQQDSQAQQLGFTLFAQLVDHEEELLGFLAGLTDLPLEKFKLIPPDVALDILTVIIQGEDLKRFFEKARALATTFAPQQ